MISFLNFLMKHPVSVFFILTLALIESCQSNAPKDTENVPVRVGVYKGDGASPVCVLETMEALKIDKGIVPMEISGADIMNGALENLDAIIFPGGSGSKEFNSLGVLAAEKVKAFALREGKGIVGICAGGYLLSTTPGYPSLEILDAPDIRDHYDRGRGLIAFHLNKTGTEIFPELKNYDSLYIQYYDGPMFDIPESSKIRVQGEIYSDIATHEGYPHGVSPGKPSFMTMNYGKGKIMVSVGHPEATAGMRWMVPRMARWVTNNEFILYDGNTVRPGINQTEILFYEEQQSFEKENFWKLFEQNDSLVISALENLHKLRSRPSIRWSIGLLRHPSWKVRNTAAKYLLESEYTYAIPDLEAAINVEKEKNNRAELQKILRQLSSFLQQ